MPVEALWPLTCRRDRYNYSQTFDQVHPGPINGVPNRLLRILVSPPAEGRAVLAPRVSKVAWDLSLLARSLGGKGPETSTAAHPLHEELAHGARARRHAAALPGSTSTRDAVNEKQER